MESEAKIPLEEYRKLIECWENRDKIQTFYKGWGDSEVRFDGYVGKDEALNKLNIQITGNINS